MDVIKDICFTKIKFYQDKFTARDRCNQTVCFHWIFPITDKNIRLINLACQKLSRNISAANKSFWKIHFLARLAMIFLDWCCDGKVVMLIAPLECGES